MYKISIIIPHYNSTELLYRLLGSIPICNSIEVIVVDDNSDMYMEEYKKLKTFFEHVKFIKNISGVKGAGACRNLGLEVANGDWILFADADDFFVSDFHEKVKKYYNYTSDIIYFVPTSLDLNTNKLSGRHIPYKTIVENYINNPNEENLNFLKYTYCVPWSKLIRRKLIIANNIKFDEVIVSNDVLFSTKIGYYAREIIAMNEIIYCVTLQPGTLTTVRTCSSHDVRTDVAIAYYKFLKEHLNKNEFEKLNFSARYILVDCVRYRLGLKQLFKSYVKLLKNDVSIFKGIFN